MNKYTVWSDSESKVYCHKEFKDLEKAAEYASRFVHKYDGKDYRVIVYIEDDEEDETIDCYENINPSCIDFDEYEETL